MNSPTIAIAFLLLALAAFLWLTAQPQTGPMRLTAPRQVSLEEYRQGASQDCPPGGT
jgi:hypothetical protein